MSCIELARGDPRHSTGEAAMSVTDWLIPLLTLTAMEIVLGIDNIIFLAIVAGKLPPEQQPKARQLGLAAALGTRLLLLLAISWLLRLDTYTLFTLPDWSFLQHQTVEETQ